MQLPLVFQELFPQDCTCSAMIPRSGICRQTCSCHVYLITRKRIHHLSKHTLAILTGTAAHPLYWSVAYWSVAYSGYGYYGYCKENRNEYRLIT